MLSKAEVIGKSKQINGAIKNKVGEVTNNPSLEAEGESAVRQIIARNSPIELPKQGSGREEANSITSAVAR